MGVDEVNFWLNWAGAGFDALLVALEHAEDEAAPLLVLVAESEAERGLFEGDGYFAADVVERLDVALVGHAGGVEEDVLFVGEGLHQELQKTVQVRVFGLEEFSRYYHA